MSKEATKEAVDVEREKLTRMNTKKIGSTMKKPDAPEIRVASLVREMAKSANLRLFETVCQKRNCLFVWSFLNLHLMLKHLPRF